MKKLTAYTTLLILVCIVLIQACKKKEETPTNPFDALNNAAATPPATAPTTTEFVSIYKSIFATKCANLGCHDGHFEPDFRSIESAYSTLVYQPVIKNTLTNSFRLRVIPFNVDSSWLHYRVTTSDNQVGRMPLYANALSTSEVQSIKTWITNGAKDMFGNPAREPNSEPTVQFFVALDPSFVRIDTNRVVKNDYTTPFILPATMSYCNFLIVPKDDHTPMSQLKNNKIKFSLDADDFSNPIATINGTYINYPAISAWMFTANPNSLPHNQTIYFRYYTNDGTRTNDTEFPYNEMIYFYKKYFSFKIQ